MSGRRLIFLIVLSACSDPEVPGAADAICEKPDAAVAVDGSANSPDAAAMDARANTPDAGLTDSGATPDAGHADDAGENRPDTGGGTLGRWVSRAQLTSNRQETGVAALAGEVYLVGGYDGLVFGRKVEAYDPVRDQWRAIADLPERLHHANTAVAGGKLYVTGYLATGFGARGRVFEYDPGFDRWAEKTPMPAGRARGASATAAIGDQIYVVGGQDGSTSRAHASIYDAPCDSWTMIDDLPLALDHLVAGVSDGVFYAIGGRSGAHTARVFAWDPDNPGWAEKAPMPTSRAGAAAAVVRGKIYVMGGEGNPAPGTNGVFAETESYDPVQNRWIIGALMRTPRHGTGAAAVNGIIYVPGGATRQGFGSVDAHEALIPPF